MNGEDAGLGRDPPRNDTRLEDASAFHLAGANALVLCVAVAVLYRDIASMVAGVPPAFITVKGAK